ncbi:IS110 family transposase [Chloroflexi bacterium TSY]|nr:IS110 family transposase [Chloroflexi bacterium TSY]
MQIFIGIDWSETKHDVMITDENGRRINYMTIEHSVDGFKQLEKWRETMDIGHEKCRIGLETAHNLIIDYLWDAGYTNLYVLPPNVVKASRARYNQSGARTDESDAYTIAELVRTDVHRFYPWHPGSELLQQMRIVVSMTEFWRKETVAVSNRLRSCLLRYHPALLNVFSWPSPIAAHLILAYPSPQAAEKATYDEFQVFLKQHKHNQPSKWLTCFDALTTQHPRSAPGVAQACQVQAQQLARLLLHTLNSKQATLQQLNSLFLQHEDHPIFASLPGAGELLAPSLLVKFGEDRRRFPHSSMVQTLAGTAPVTNQSGKVHLVHFRRSCDKEFRYFSQQLARSSRQQSRWASAYFTQARQKGPLGQSLSSGFSQPLAGHSLENVARPNHL